MRPDDFESFSEVVAGFAELRGKQLSPAAIKLYWNAMQHWSIEDFRSAAQHLVLSCQFMPTPKDFEDLRRADRPTATEAWAKILAHCKGAYRDGSGIDSGGPIDTAVAGIGGYRAIAFHDTDYLPLLQRQFVERFEETTDVFESRQAALPDARSGQGKLVNLGGK